jgi:16S rRNA (cytosine1402-N4)-methyltransferase
MTAAHGREHIPVMTAEVMRYLQPERGGLFVDCTLGLGGHARAMLEGGATRVIGIDRDGDALQHARSVLAPWAEKLDLVHSDYRAIDAVLESRHVA